MRIVVACRKSACVSAASVFAASSGDRLKISETMYEQMAHPGAAAWCCAKAVPDAPTAAPSKKPTTPTTCVRDRRLAWP